MLSSMSKFSIVTIVGAPNAGKSTLFNTILGNQISIVTHKVHTTRRKVHHMYSEGDINILFVDSPGLFSAKSRFEKGILSEAENALNMADQIYVLFDAAIFKVSDTLISYVKKAECERKYAVLNKVDKLKDKAVLLGHAGRLGELKLFEEIFMISALKKRSVQEVLDQMKANAYETEHPPGDMLEDIIDIAADITLKYVYIYLHEELPYHIDVRTDDMHEEEDKLVIHQSIIVHKESHKAIVLGARGASIKSIGSKARKEMGKLFTQHINLFLNVRVEKLP